MSILSYYDERGTCIKGLIWPPLEPKSESCFSPISFDWFIRRITQCKTLAFIKILMVSMVTKKANKIGLK